MALRFNAVTGRMEEDGTTAVRPLTGGPIDLAPDDVKPSDLIVSADPRHPYGQPLLGTTRAVDVADVHDAPASGKEMLPLPGGPPRDSDLPPVKPAKFVEPFPIAGEGDVGPPAPLPAGPAPAPARKGGGGGGGGPRPTGGHLTLQETLAQGALANAYDEQDQSVRDSGDLEARKADAMARQADEQAASIKQAQEAWQKKRTEAEQHLQEREEAAAKTPIRDLFEGRPLSLLVAAIAAGAGARASAITGTENTALRVLNDASSAYRQKQQLTYEREMAGVTNEKERLQYSTMQAAADEAGLLRRFELDRTKKLQEYGADEARIKSDSTLAALATRRAELQSEIATSLYKRGQDEVMQSAQVGAARASAAHSMAETRKTDAETQQIAAGGGPGGSRRPSMVEIQKAQMAEKGADALAKREALVAKGVALTEADRQRIQDNRKDLESQLHMNPLKAKLLRGGRVLARSPYEGLSGPKQELARNNDVLTQAGAVISSPSVAEHEVNYARGLYDLNAPRQGADAQSGTLDTIRGFIGSAKALGDRYTAKAEAGAEAERAAARPQALSKEDIVRLTAEANKRLQANPNDPLARGALERLRSLRAGGGG